MWVKKSKKEKTHQPSRSSEGWKGVDAEHNDVRGGERERTGKHRENKNGQRKATRSTASHILYTHSPTPEPTLTHRTHTFPISHLTWKLELVNIGRGLSAISHWFTSTHSPETRISYTGIMWVPNNAINVNTFKNKWHPDCLNSNFSHIFNQICFVLSASCTETVLVDRSVMFPCS